MNLAARKVCLVRANHRNVMDETPLCLVSERLLGCEQMFAYLDSSVEHLIIYVMEILVPSANFVMEKRGTVDTIHDAKK